MSPAEIVAIIIISIAAFLVLLFVLSLIANVFVDDVIELQDEEDSGRR